MNPRELLPVEALVSADARRTPLEIATDTAPLMPASISEDCADCWQHLPTPARMRKASEVALVLNLLDSIGKDGAN